MADTISCTNTISTKSHLEDDLESGGHIFYHLMPFKVREILLVSSLYDAFVIQEEGLIPELIIGEYSHLHLSYPPHVTRVSSGEKALEKVKKQTFDLVITMSKNIGMDPFEFGSKIKEHRPELPVVLLATETSDLHKTMMNGSQGGIDKIFYWNGDSQLFLAIIKYIEDKKNVAHDTSLGNVRVLIMVEDSVRYYSMFLPRMYTQLMHQTQQLLSGELNEMQRLLRMRARPKILLADNYEDAKTLFDTYKDFILGVISDVSFRHEGDQDPDAGYHFINYIRKNHRPVPVLIQSSNPENRSRTQDLGAYFLDKNSGSLLQDFHHFMISHLGFGDFIFLLPLHNEDVLEENGDNVHLPGSDDGRNKRRDWLHDSTIEIARASNLREFELMLRDIPPDSLRFHAERNNYSNWLMARGEIKLAQKLLPKKVTEFRDANAITEYLLRVFKEYRKQKQKGMITEFPKQTFEFESSFTRLGGGSLGGKGRGIAFMKSLLSRCDLSERFPAIDISIPNSVVIATEEFDRFMKENDLYTFLENPGLTDSDIAGRFRTSTISRSLMDQLTRLLHFFLEPIAVRSSSMLEDSQNHPFAGIYSTYMLPNNHENISTRLEQLTEAIKLVYASIFFSNARSYIESTSSKIEEEKMAVIIQEVVGVDHGGRFYPTFSGVAQSYNFYPLPFQKCEDGIISLAMGLGKTIVGGEKVLRFSPRFPENIPDFSTPELIFQNSQKKLYVLNTRDSEIVLKESDDSTLEKLDVMDVERDGTLEHIASTFDVNNNIIRDTTDGPGAKLLTFAGILKYNKIPLSSILRDLLILGESGMGCPVEMEFAVELKQNNAKPLFSILQIRPFVSAYEHSEIAWDPNIDRETLLVHSNMALGNGIMDSIRDIIYVPGATFDVTQTIQIASEVGQINAKLISDSLPYILIGPGRWGTQDRWLGIPVNWSQISGVRVMVETALRSFNIEPSQGTHFFQNFISRKIGYITIPYNSLENFLDFQWLEDQEVLYDSGFVRHIRLPSPLIIKLDGRKGSALIIKQQIINQQDDQQDS